MNVRKQNYLKGSLILMLSAAAAKVLGALFKIPLTDMLGGVGMSYFSCAYSLFMPVYAFAVTGVSSAVARLTAKSAALGAMENAHKVRRTALALFSGVGLAGSIIVLVLARPFSVYSADSPEAALSVAMIAPAVLFGCITAVERGYYEGLSNMYPTAVSQVVEGFVKVAAGLFMCHYVMNNSSKIMRYFPYITDVKALAAAAGILGVTLSSLGAVLFMCIMRLSSRSQKTTERTVMSRKEIVHELISAALPIGISAVVTNLTALIDMWTVISRIPASTLSGVSAEDYPRFVYGSFAGIALTIFNLVPSVTNMLGKGALTLTASAWEKNDKESLRNNAMQALYTAAVIAVPAAVGLGVMSGEVLEFLFPHQSDEAAVCVDALKVLMPGMVCLCISYPLFSMLQAIGKASVPLKIMLAGTAIKFAGNYFLIPVIGVDGAALSTTICYSAILLLSLWSFTVYAGVKLEMLPFIKVIYSGAMCGGTAYLMSSLLRSGSLFIDLAVTACVGGAVYFAMICCVTDRAVKKKRACTDADS